MNSKLIIVDGHCSVGKSSISKSVFKQIALDEEAYWLHEECENHPIRQDEFTFGKLDTIEGMELNRSGMLKKWTDFRDSIKASGKVCITEGCFLHAYDRYFIHSIWNEEDIVAYCDQVLGIIRELNPLLVLLYRPDLRTSLEKAFIARGKWWRDLILKRDDDHIYIKNHPYIDENSMFDAIDFEQRMIINIFDQLHCHKVKVDTSEENWEQYTSEILNFNGSKYYPPEKINCDFKAYTGRYRWLNGKQDEGWTINFDDKNNCLYTTLFWPYMPMRYVSENVFELISFPVEMRFNRDERGLSFIVHGNYDWEYNDQVFVKV